MIKFAVQSLITLVLTSSALLLTPMRSDAQVNMKLLAQVAESCQKDVPSKSYYQKMLLDINRINASDIETCVQYRYHYSLVLAQFPWLSSKGEIMPGYPGSVVISRLGSWWGNTPQRGLLDCLIAQDASSDVCFNTRNDIAIGYKIRNPGYGNGDRYLVYVCPSCVVAHDEASGSKTEILKAFIQWVFSLEKPERREVISLLGDEDRTINLRYSLRKKSEAAVQEYQEVRARVQQQERERSRQELLGQ